MVNRVTSCEEVWREVSNYVDGEVEAALPQQGCKKARHHHCPGTA